MADTIQTVSLKDFTKALKDTLKPMEASLGNMEKSLAQAPTKEAELEAKKLEKKKLDEEIKQTSWLKKLLGKKDAKDKKEGSFFSKHWGKLLIALSGILLMFPKSIWKNLLSTKWWKDKSWQIGKWILGAMIVKKVWENIGSIILGSIWAGLKLKAKLFNKTLKTPTPADEAKARKIAEEKIKKENLKKQKEARAKAKADKLKLQQELAERNKAKHTKFRDFGKERIIPQDTRKAITERKFLKTTPTGDVVVNKAQLRAKPHLVTKIPSTKVPLAIGGPRAIPQIDNAVEELVTEKVLDNIEGKKTSVKSKTFRASYKIPTGLGTPIDLSKRIANIAPNIDPPGTMRNKAGRLIDAKTKRFVSQGRAGGIDLPKVNQKTSKMINKIKPAIDKAAVAAKKIKNIKAKIPTGGAAGVLGTVGKYLLPLIYADNVIESATGWRSNFLAAAFGDAPLFEKDVTKPLSFMDAMGEGVFKTYSDTQDIAPIQAYFHNKFFRKPDKEVSQYIDKSKINPNSKGMGQDGLMELTEYHMDPNYRQSFMTPEKVRKVYEKGVSNVKSLFKKGLGKVGSWFSPSDAEAGETGQKSLVEKVKKASKIDWGFISTQEGGQLLDGYVPGEGKGEFAKSGVTVSTGFDLGQWSKDDLKGLNDSGLVTKLSPYIGLHGTKAQEKLDKTPLKITKKQAEKIDEFAKTKTLNRVKTVYGKKWDTFSSAQKTVAASVGFQYGAEGTPTFTKHMKAGHFMSAINELTNKNKWKGGKGIMKRLYRQGNLLFNDPGLAEKLFPDMDPAARMQVMEALDNANAHLKLNSGSGGGGVVQINKGGDDNSTTNTAVLPQENHAQDRSFWGMATGWFRGF